MLKYLKQQIIGIFLFTFLPFFLLKADSEFSKSSVRDAYFSPYSTEGYLQAWSFHFYSDRQFFQIVFGVSHLGPGNLNHGLMVVQYTDSKPKFFTEMSTQQGLVVDKKHFYFKSGKSGMKYRRGKYKVFLNLQEIKLQLELSANNRGRKLSAGRHYLKTGGFIKSDTLVSFGTAKLSYIMGNKKVELKGRGGLEHLLMNREVYQFSKAWEIHRFMASSGERVYLGGFEGKGKESAFYTIIVEDKNGKLVYSKILQDRKNNSDILSKKQIKFDLENRCEMEVKLNSNYEKIDLLSRSPIYIRVFIRLFFTKPYLYTFRSSFHLNCPRLMLPLYFQEGISSYYSIDK